MSNDLPWRPKSYPTQSCAEKASHDDSTLSPELGGRLPQLPATIPAVQDSRSSSAGGRTLVICLDGTGDKFDSDNSNVVNFVSCLKKDDPSQITYYQSGIGTYDGHGLTRGFSALVDMAVGSGLGVHIKDAYRFLMQNYREGDRICLLGFSRGSYTVRCLAGMLHKVGLLPRHNRAQVSFAYSFYKNDTPEGWKMSAEFKKTFCTNVDVYFVGIWDCVASVGFIPRVLPFSKSPTNTVRYFRHAMALDEHRAKFKVCLWQHPEPAPELQDTVESSKHGRLRRIFSAFSMKPGAGAAEKRVPITISEIQQAKERERTQLELQFEKDDHSVHENPGSDVLEVWFTGAHADIGGGAVLNEERHMLSRIPLRWMIRQCFECNTGILFSAAALAEVGIDVPTVWPIYVMPKRPVVGPSPSMVEQYEAKSLPPLRRRSTALGLETNGRRKGEGKAEVVRTNIQDAEKSRLETDLLPEQVEDHFDAMAPINDQLEKSRAWWILEFWPIKLRVQKKNSEEWEKVVGINLGRFRAIPDPEPKMHWTVQMRMDNKAYKIRNRVDTSAVWHLAT